MAPLVPVSAIPVSVRWPWSRAAGSTHHCRLGREELEGEVVGAIRQRVDLIRNLLHGKEGTKGEIQSGVAEDGVSWLQVRKEQKVRESASGGRRWGIGSTVRILGRHRHIHALLSRVPLRDELSADSHSIA